MDAQWRTIGGGGPALIDLDSGSILEACPGLEGYDVDELGETQEERSNKQKLTEAHGLTGRDIPREASQQWTDAENPPAEVEDAAALKMESLSQRLWQAKFMWRRQPPTPIKAMMGSFMKLPEVKQKGFAQTRQLHDEYVRRVYGQLQEISDRGDGFGTVHDLSEHLGGMAIGYHSPAGMVAIVPPETKQSEWEVRYALPPGGEVSLAGAPALRPAPFDPTALGVGAAPEVSPPPPRTEGQPQPTPSAPPAEPQPAPEATPERPRRRTLKAVMDEAVGEDPEARRMFAETVKMLQQEKADRIRTRNEAVDFIVGNAAGSAGARSALTRAIKAAEDADQVPRFDEMVQVAENNFPWILAGGVGASEDLEDNLFNELKKGKLPMPSALDEEILAEAFDQLAQWEESGGAEEVEEEAEPFALMHGPRFWRDRYEAWKGVSLRRRRLGQRIRLERYHGPARRALSAVH